MNDDARTDWLKVTIPQGKMLERLAQEVYVAQRSSAPEAVIREHMLNRLTEIAGARGLNDMSTSFIAYLQDRADETNSLSLQDAIEKILAFLQQVENTATAMRQLTSWDSEIVDQFYEMNPETEDLLDNGTLVVDGMTVLIENPVRRGKTRGTTDYELAQARMMNRWAVVSNAVVENRLLSFVANYADGTKRKITMSVREAWIVKKDTIPPAREQSKYEMIREIVKSGFEEVVPSMDLVSYGVQEIIDKTTTTIMNRLVFDEIVTVEEIREENDKRSIQADVIGQSGEIVFSGTVESVLCHNIDHLHKDTLTIHVEGYQMSADEFIERYDK